MSNERKGEFFIAHFFDLCGENSPPHLTPSRRRDLIAQVEMFSYTPKMH